MWRKNFTVLQRTRDEWKLKKFLMCINIICNKCYHVCIISSMSININLWLVLSELLWWIETHIFWPIGFQHSSGINGIKWPIMRYCRKNENSGFSQRKFEIPPNLHLFPHWLLQMFGRHMQQIAPWCTFLICVLAMQRFGLRSEW